MEPTYDFLSSHSVKIYSVPNWAWSLGLCLHGADTSFGYKPFSFKVAGLRPEEKQDN